MRRCLALLALAAVAWAANVKLYLKDGGYQLVREYQVLADRVRFYSVQSEDWEEIPLDLVDLKRTEAETGARRQAAEENAKALADEEAAQHAIKQEVARIPQDPGVYWLASGLASERAKTMQAAEVTVHMDKRRDILRVFTPGGTLPGKGTLEIPGIHAATTFTNPEQEFYIQLSAPERFGIARLTPKGALRIVENLTYDPMLKTMTEEPDMVETLHQQFTSDILYKLWPKDPLPPGEYAVVEYTQSKINMQVWDFSIQAAK